MKRCLIVCCPRSGSKFISDVLCASGLDIGHEREGRDGKVSWGGIMEVLTLEIRPMGKNGIAYDKNEIWHQVRDPLKCIASMNVTKGGLRDRLWGYVPSVKFPDSSLCNWAMFWMHWNKCCEEQASRTYRVEDIDTVYPQMLQWRGLLNKCIPAIPRDTNTRGADSKHSPITYDSFNQYPDIRAELEKAAKHYGYLR